ncbi:hypothetical protein STCU_09231 [Strigomonas culicis]|uniref:Conserved Oligomeric Golgi complex subunit 6 C-terminal domain-containing protein n=1 Tax=Strigomonas culicis TaxID=28005 RepID=S9UZ71_9TRYP|nr:hypothetical protein STCU_09231 [Strigomonas culicis]|eukprot:EPY19941.1 hypothetical protein STCU_09231 [Strigomonas culicis]
MESSFALLNKGLDKVLRYVLSPSTAAAADAARHGEVNLTADVPELTPLYLQCVTLLREERPAMLLRVVEEVTRLRRASVLRRYFHLLTTGSATTSTGVYRGGQSQQGGGDSGIRPLEAELHNPVFFFSSLFAWMHQTMVEESDFLSLFLPDAGVAAAATTSTTATTGTGRAHYLDAIFSVLVKHMKSALDTILERFIKATAVDADGDDSKRGGGGGGGLKSGFTRLFMAATGRRSLSHDGRGGADDDEDSERVYHLQQRYGAVVSRPQMEQTATAAVRPLLQGVQVAFALLQLFSYYVHATFTPLLRAAPGEAGGEWLLFMEDYALLELIKVYQVAVKRLGAHLCDSVIGALPKLAPAERLLRRAGAGEEGPAPEAEGKGSLLQFLMQQVLRQHVLTSGHSNALNLSSTDVNLHTASTATAAVTTTANAAQHQRTVAKDTLQVLATFILPPSPELQSCLAVLQQFLRETQRHEEVLLAVAQQQQRTPTPRRSSSGAAAAHESDLYFTILVQALLSFALTLPQQPPIHRHLGKSLGQLLSYNVHYGLYSAIAPTLAAERQEEAAGGSEGVLRNIVGPLREKLEELREALGAAYAAAALAFFFADVEAAVETDALTDSAAKKVWDRLQEFYSTIATYGLPPSLPLLQTLADEAGRQGIERRVRDGLLRRYDELYQLVWRHRNGGTGKGSAEENMDEMSPHNVKVLLGM